MQLKVFVLPVKNLGAAEAEMSAFLRGHRVLAVKLDRRRQSGRTLAGSEIVAVAVLQERARSPHGQSE